MFTVCHMLASLDGKIDGAFFGRDFPAYLFLRTPFVFFDFDEPLRFFFLDYLAISGLFIWIGHALAKRVRAARRET